MKRATLVALYLIAVAVVMWPSGIVPAIVPAIVPTANKRGNSTKFQIADAASVATNDCAKFDANGNLTTAGAACGTSTPAWSSLTNPSGNLSLTMAANTSLFTFNAATGSNDLFKLTDTTNNSGTGVILRASSASGSSAPPWQADNNGKGYQVTTAGAFTGVGQTASTNVAFQGATSGTCNLTTQAVAVGITPGSARECNWASKSAPFNGTFSSYIEGGTGQPAVDNSSCSGAAIGTGATNLAGTITGLPTGACTVKITFANSATATTGWSCGVSDRTTGNLFRQTTTDATSATFSGTSVSGDVLQYGPCGAY